MQVDRVADKEEDGWEVSLPPKVRGNGRGGPTVGVDLSSPSPE